MMQRRSEEGSTLWKTTTGHEGTLPFRKPLARKSLDIPTVTAGAV